MRRGDSPRAADGSSGPGTGGVSDGGRSARGGSILSRRGVHGPEVAGALPRPRAGALAAIFGLAAAISGCGGVPAGDGTSRTTALLRDIRRAHGVVAPSQQPAGVRFSYRAWVDDARPLLELPEIAFWLDDPRYLWFRSLAEAEPVRLEIAAAPAEVLRDLRQNGVPIATGEPAEEGLAAHAAFALRSLRYLFHLPLATAHGRWEFRSLLSPSGIEAPAVLEVTSQEPGSPLGPCVLYSEAETGLLAKVVYVGRDPPTSGSLWKVTFSDYGEEGGIRVALRRCHSAVESADPRALDPPDPFGISRRRRAEEPACRLREEVRGIRFLGLEEMEARYPRPEDEEAEGSGDAESAGTASGGSASAAGRRGGPRATDKEAR